MKTLSIEEEFNRLIDDTFPNKNGGNTLTYRRKREYQNFFFLGFRAALGTVIGSSGGNEDEYQKAMDSKCAELDKFFEGEVVLKDDSPATDAKVEIVD